MLTLVAIFVCMFVTGFVIGFWFAADIYKQREKALIFLLDPIDPEITDLSHVAELN